MLVEMPFQPVILQPALLLKTKLRLKMTVFWDVAPCSLGDYRPDDGGSKHL
jgi:hypothetical protein